MIATEGAVRAFIRWEDLSIAVTQYAALLQLDPGLVLHAALILPKALEALTSTDPAQRRWYANQLRASIDLSTSGMSLETVIQNIRRAVECRPAFDAFGVLGRENLPAVVH
jgi:hypothetical protein